MYYTQDWTEARRSAEKLAALDPEILVTGHGPALRGKEMKEALQQLATKFDDVAVPTEGRSLENPAGIGSGRIR